VGDVAILEELHHLTFGLLNAHVALPFYVTGTYNNSL
jgi:hypothetical protein